MKKWLNKCYGLLVVVILAGGLYGCSDEAVSKDVSAIKARLEKIEARLENIEKSAKKVGLLEADLQKLQQSMEAWERAITARLATASKKTSGPRTKAVETKKNSKQKEYVIEKGDSLFRIAQKYEMTVDQLCKLNKITTKTVLRPGEKLLVYSK